MTSKPLKTVEELKESFREEIKTIVFATSEVGMNFHDYPQDAVRDRVLGYADDILEYANDHYYQLMLSLVGEDEYPDAHFSTYLSGKEIERYDRVTARDRLRAELRAKLSEHFNVEGEV